MRKVYVNENKTVEIGYNGENAAVALCFPFVELWHSLYGEGGTFSVVLKKPKRDEPYIKETFEDEKDAYCVIEEADVADIGYGYAVLIYSVGDNVVARSKAYAISVDRSLLAGEDPVEPYQAYIDSILEAASDAINARTGAETAEASALQHAQDAETSATSASTSATSAEGFAEQARQSAETVQNKLTPIHLYYDDTLNVIKDKDGNTLNYQQVYALTTQGNTQVTVNYSDFIYRLVGYYGNAIEFTNAYLYDGNEWSGRIIINSDNAVRFDEVPNVHDVRINGTSIVQNGVAEIPKADTSKLGLVGIYVENGLFWNGPNIAIRKANEQRINARTYNYDPIVPSNLDYAVKAAMTDGKGPAWSEAEQLAARERIGVGEWDTVFDQVLTEAIGITTYFQLTKKYKRYLAFAINNSTSFVGYSYFQITRGMSTQNEKVEVVFSTGSNKTTLGYVDIEKGICTRFSNGNTTGNTGSYGGEIFDAFDPNVLTHFRLYTNGGNTIPEGTRVVLLGQN